jgi:hypothetical protein
MTDSLLARPDLQDLKSDEYGESSWWPEVLLGDVVDGTMAEGLGGGRAFRFRAV